MTIAIDGNTFIFLVTKEINNQGKNTNKSNGVTYSRIERINIYPITIEAAPLHDLLHL